MHGYGMVNKVFQSYFEENHGDDKWQEILAKAGTSTKDFVSMEQYPDEDLVALVVAGSEVLDKEPGELLEELGIYWIDFALRSEYGNIMKMAGNNLPEVLANLDNMHVRIGHSFPNLKPPSFWVTDQNDASFNTALFLSTEWVDHIRGWSGEGARQDV